MGYYPDDPVYHHGHGTTKHIIHPSYYYEPMCSSPLGLMFTLI